MKFYLDEAIHLCIVCGCCQDAGQGWAVVADCRLAKPEVLVWPLYRKTALHPVLSHWSEITLIVGVQTVSAASFLDSLLWTKCLESRAHCEGWQVCAVEITPSMTEPLNLCDVLPCSLWSMLVRVYMQKVSHLLLGTLSKWHINCNKCK